MMVKGGGSGALSPIGITPFGSEIFASSLHQEICTVRVREEGSEIMNAYALVFYDRVLYC